MAIGINCALQLWTLRCIIFQMVLYVFVAGGLSSQSLHSHGPSAQGSSLHRYSARPAVCPVCFWFRTMALPQGRFPLTPASTTACQVNVVLSIIVTLTIFVLHLSL